jgi:hypothetical protein
MDGSVSLNSGNDSVAFVKHILKTDYVNVVKLTYNRIQSELSMFSSNIGTYS